MIAVEPVFPEHMVEVVNSSDRLLGGVLDAVEEVWVFFVNVGGEVTTVVEDRVRILATSETLDGLVNTRAFLLGPAPLQVKTRMSVMVMVAAAWS